MSLFGREFPRLSQKDVIMKAVIQKSYGSVDELELLEIDRPEITDDQVLVKVHAASVHPDVWHVVAGWPLVLRFFGSGITKPKNQVPGTDMAGVVERVGKNVKDLKAGDEVFGETIDNMQWVNGGAYAEYVAVNRSNLARKPANVSFEQAAAIPTAGYIVLLNLKSILPLSTQSRVLVNGAGGGTSGPIYSRGCRAPFGSQSLVI